jgi:hypothetical protein
MLTTNKSWQVIANTNNLPKVNATDANLTGSKQNNSASGQVNAYMMKIVTPKRYSFDDNGGGYQGL